jgi:cysteine synthase
MSNHLNVFEGPAAVRDLLDPGRLPYLPLVELPAELNPFAGDNVRIFAKLITLLPLGNVKAVPAFNMIAEMHRRGELAGVRRIVENSSGNTVSSLALVGRQFGVDETKSYVSAEISWHKLLTTRKGRRWTGATVAKFLGSPGAKRCRSGGKDGPQGDVEG